MRPGRSGSGSIATGRRSSCTRRRGPTWTVAPAIPGLALARNGNATGVLATACAARDIDLVAISTNEVFDGRRNDGVGYAPTDPTSPPNPYGTSKLAGERAATEAYDARPGARLGIVRTAWLFGPPGRDFPRKILEAADRAAAAGEPLRVVGDEYGTPTFARRRGGRDRGVAGRGRPRRDPSRGERLFASRALWAEYLVGRFSLPITIEHVPGTTWERASIPPRWGVLAATALPSGEPLRSWPDAMADYAPALERAWRRERVAT